MTILYALLVLLVTMLVTTIIWKKLAESVINSQNVFTLKKK